MTVFMSIVNAIVDFMQSEIIVIDTFSFSLWEILIVSTASVILADLIGSVLNINR